jgi:hypothetical protein
MLRLASTGPPSFTPTPPVPWRLETEALYRDVRVASALLVESFAEVEWPQRARNDVWRRLSAQVSPPERRGWLAPVAYAGWAFAAVTAAALVVTGLPTRPPNQAAPAPATHSEVAFEARAADWEPVSLGAEGNLRVKPGSRLELTAGRSAVPGATGEATSRRILLREGELCAQVTHRDVARQGPLIVEAPQMTVVVIGTKFCFETHAGVAHVNVTEGRVRVETSGGMSTEVGAGQEIRSDDVRLRALLSASGAGPAAFVAQPSAVPAVKGCAGVAGIIERASCYSHVADGSGLSAQNALYGLGLLARDAQHNHEAALRYWRDYQQRFPKGALAPEASVGILGEFMVDGRYAEAVEEADHYLQRFPDELGAEVTLTKAEILQTGLNSPDSAIPLYLSLLTGELAPPLRQEVLYSMGLCEQQEGYTSQASELWRRYLSSFPHGPHSAQVSGLLGVQ